ncbi:MAG: SGNH/GDSL hydrolase family protein [Lachnospiraceae bacterium]|nr:SGNH/GDSL hydrolase family protein [Lachnospiraceae bacterium]
MKLSFKSKFITLSVLLFLVFSLYNAVELNAAGSKSSSRYTPKIKKIVTTRKVATISWTKVSDANGYFVYRRAYGEKKYKKIKTLNSKYLSFSDKKIKAGLKYYYRIVSNRPGKNYISKTGTAISSNVPAAKLKDVKSFVAKSDFVNQLSWYRGKYKLFAIYRKTNGSSWKQIANVKTSKSVGTYIDKSATASRKYVYTVRPINVVGVLQQYGNYDSKGITPYLGKIRTQPSSINFNNLNATIKWNKVSGADGYLVYRKFGLNGKYRSIAKVKGTSFVDKYGSTFNSTEKKAKLRWSYYLDDSYNDLVYTIRAYKYNGDKLSLSNFYNSGRYKAVTPTIVSANNSAIKWTGQKNASFYYILVSTNGTTWKAIKKVTTKYKYTLSYKINTSAYRFVSVRAVYVKDGSKYYSGYDTGFRKDQRKYTGTRVLYIGDSITWGVPYSSTSSAHIFSYPWRVNQITGVNYYNPSIPQATYATNPSNTSRKRIVTDVIERLYKKQEPLKNSNYLSSYPNYTGQNLASFDVVVMAAGTNDYTDNRKISNVSNETDTSTFNGALNKIFYYINEASKARVKAGKKPIKVVMNKLFYSDGGYNSDGVYGVLGQLNNRFTMKNKVGYTLTDYQNAINNSINVQKSISDNTLLFYTFDTYKYCNSSNCRYNTADNIHMNRFTYSQIGNGLSEFLIKNRIIG